MKRVLLIDNYDSFTYNLFQYLRELGAEVDVFRNDAISLSEIQSRSCSHIVLSPGPGHPKNTKDIGIGRAIVGELASRLPILGVCLGHQTLVHVHGGEVIGAPEIVHGKAALIKHQKTGLFENLDSPVMVMRYHSLMVERTTLPACFNITAETEEGIVMAVAHREHPLFGVQFHPESIGTPTGKTILANFLNQEVRS